MINPFIILHKQSYSIHEFSRTLSKIFKIYNLNLVFLYWQGAKTFAQYYTSGINHSLWINIWPKHDSLLNMESISHLWLCLAFIFYFTPSYYYYNYYNGYAKGFVHRKMTVNYIYLWPNTSGIRLLLTIWFEHNKCF